MARNKTDLAAAVHGAAKDEPRAPERAPRKQTKEAPPKGSQEAPARPKSREGTKGVLIHVSPETSRELRQIALDEDTTVQALGLEAFTRFIAGRKRRKR